MKNEPTDKQSKQILDEGDALWNILGSASEKETSEMFSRKIMYQIRSEAYAEDPKFSSFMKSWVFAFVSGSAAACAIFFFSSQPNQKAPVQTVVQSISPSTPPVELIPIYSFEQPTDAEQLLISSVVDSPESYTDEEVLSILF